MKEYLEFNNADDKRLIMICIPGNANALHYFSTDIRRECMGLPIIHQFKNFKSVKISLSEILKTRSIRKLAELGSFNLSKYSEYFEAVRKYDRRYNK